MRREERVTVQGPVKEQQPDGMSYRGVSLRPNPRDRPPPRACCTNLMDGWVYKTVVGFRAMPHFFGRFALQIEIQQLDWQTMQFGSTSPMAIILRDVRCNPTPSPSPSFWTDRWWVGHSGNTLKREYQYRYRHKYSPFDGSPPLPLPPGPCTQRRYLESHTRFVVVFLAIAYAALRRLALGGGWTRLSDVNLTTPPECACLPAGQERVSLEKGGGGGYLASRPRLSKLAAETISTPANRMCNRQNALPQEYPLASLPPAQPLRGQCPGGRACFLDSLLLALCSGMPLMRLSAVWRLTDGVWQATNGSFEIDRRWLVVA